LARLDELPRYCSANPSGRLQKDVETVKGSCDPFPFDDLLSNIKDIRGWCNNNNYLPHNEGVSKPIC